MSNDDYQHINFFEIGDTDLHIKCNEIVNFLKLYRESETKPPPELKAKFETKKFFVSLSGVGNEDINLSVIRKADMETATSICAGVLYEFTFSMNGVVAKFYADEQMYELLKQHFTNGK